MWFWFGPSKWPHVIWFSSCRSIEKIQSNHNESETKWNRKIKVFDFESHMHHRNAAPCILAQTNRHIGWLQHYWLANIGILYVYQSCIHLLGILYLPIRTSYIQMNMRILNIGGKNGDTHLWTLTNWISYIVYVVMWYVHLF